jgi:cold shock CspA family protein
MRTLFIAAASALFFAAIVTELSMRLWPDDYVALLVITFVALFVSGTLNLKLAGLFGATRQDTRPRRGNRGQRAQQPAQSREQRARGRDKDGNGRQKDGDSRPKGGDGRQKGGDGRKSQARPAEPPPPDGPRETGTVKWFNRNKGFGFVIRESGQEIFVHQRSIRMIGEGDNRRRPNLKDGQSVTFVVAEREKGLQAEDVVPGESD